MKLQLKNLTSIQKEIILLHQQKEMVGGMNGKLDGKKEGVGITKILMV